jgi:pimeloyl-[acyl-carrier protein] methyl ester esterase
VTVDARVTGLHVQAAGQGRPLVLLHGWGLHGGLFGPVVPSLARTHRVHAVDLPGHGRSAPLRPFTLAGVVGELERTFAATPGAIDVLGWSLGGVAALAWARAHPRRIRRLVLVATTPKFVADAGWPHAMERGTLARFADELGVAYRLTLQRFLSLQVQGSEDGRATLAALRHQLFAHGEPDAAALRDALGALAATDVRDAVRDIAQPTLVIGGDRDTLSPLPASEWLADAMPDARLLTIRGAAHAPFLSHRTAFAAAVAEFLADG